MQIINRKKYELLIIVSFSTIVSTFLLFTKSDPSFRLIAGFYVCYSLFFPLWMKKNLLADPFHPYWVYRILIFIFVVLPIALTPKNDQLFSYTTCVVILLTAVSFVALMDVIGLSVPRLLLNNYIGYDRKNSKATVFFVFIWAMGWFARTSSLRSGLVYGTLLATQLEISPLGNFFAQLNNISQIALFGYAIFSQKKTPSIFLILMACSEIIWMLLSGSKAGILYVLIPLLLIYNHKNALAFSVKKVMGIIVVGALLFVSFSFVQQYRVMVQVRAFAGDPLSIKTLAESATQALEGSIAGINTEKTSEGMSGRINWAVSYGLILENPDLSKAKWNGSSYLPILTWWIPRVLWREKPVVSVGHWFGQEVLGWDYLGRSEGAITLWGDALMNFGLPGILPVQLIWLLIMFMLYHMSLRLGQWGLLFLSSIYVRMLLGLEQNPAVPLAAFQQTLLIVVAVCCMLKITTDFFRLASKGVNE